MLFHHPSGQEECKNNANDQLLLLGQPVHGGNLTVKVSSGKFAVIIGLTSAPLFTIVLAKPVLRWQVLPP
jgi:hypothetical protein